MEETTHSDTSNGSNKRKILFIVIGLLVLTNLVVLFLFYQNNQEKADELQTSQTELQETYAKLESISNELDLKIQEIQKLGGDVEELRLIRETLEQEKEQLQNDQVLAQKRYNQINARVEGYRELLINKDKEIAQLQEENKVLFAENTELKEEQQELNKTITQINSDKDQLAEKVAVASQLEAENIKVIGLNSRGKGKERDRYRSSQLEQVQVTFNIAKNEVAEIKGRDIFVRIIEPNGNVIFDVAKGSGTFMLDSEEIFYTMKKDILFDNTGQALSFIYEKGSDYTEGRHQVEIYADDYIIGTANFDVR
ncbi:chromosome segregation protein SMC [Tunicatimonas pelagia]|uniref:chromosome segregation protein SMC n=1 Tax=Tunicatimonas pelagia TaxID=931531 RepID=UPI002665EF32|nr:chromosome segregation protein SMC [Tunicatimonas pelagia]WKN41998.1 chromosome segregation protein SMC [Tunicatimonas pelagia]